METLARKLIARAAGQSGVSAGDVVICKVDLAMIHDSGGPRRVKPMLERLGRRVWDRDRVVVVTDHYVPADTEETRAIQALTRQWVQDEDIANFYDQQGICHVVLPERGHLSPGMFCVGGDSHSPTGGAFGAYMFGVGATEMAGVLATGEIWLRVPETILIQWNNSLGACVTAKDMMLAVCGEIGMGGGRYQAIQYAGTAIRNLSMQERMTMSNMAAELGAQAAKTRVGPSFAYELADCSRGIAFAYGGIYPGTLHAKGELIKTHTVHYSIGSAGRYMLHVGLRQQGVARRRHGPGGDVAVEVRRGSVHGGEVLVVASAITIAGSDEVSLRRPSGLAVSAEVVAFEDDLNLGVLRITDIRRTSMVASINLYCNNKKSRFYWSRYYGTRYE